MDDVRKKIFNFVRKLQFQIGVPLWSLANESVIYALSKGKKPVWGSKIRILHKIMRFADKLKLGDCLIFCVGLMRASTIWWSIKKKAPSQKILTYKRVFAGFDAAPEEYLYADYLKQSQEPSLRINWVTHSGLEKLGCPSIINIISLLIKNAFGHTVKLTNALPEISSNKIEFLTICALNIGQYAFYRAYWRMAKSREITTVTFIAPDIPAFACIDEKLESIFHQHGLMTACLLMSKFDRISVLTKEEKQYLQSLLKNTTIDLVPKQIVNQQKNNVLMILSPNLYDKQQLKICDSLVQSARKFNLQIVMRPTTKATPEELIRLSERIPGILLDDIVKPLEESYKKWCPKWVAATWSTGLVTALDFGSLPISISDSDTNEVWNHMIYPMKHKVLFWPKDQVLLEQTLQIENFYQEQLDNLQSINVEECA